jgi:muramoyltetrapeptide carboxypeptidase
MTIAPSYLQKGDTVAIVATARFIAAETLLPVRALFKAWGLQVYIHPSLYLQDHQFAGNDAQRAEMLQDLLDNTTIKAIICARGGYGTTRIIDQIDFTTFKKHPKWIAGFSDVTALHARLQHLHIQSLHSIMPVLFDHEKAKNSVRSLQDTLFGKPNTFHIAAHAYNKKGQATAPLIGGNLSIVAHLMGTPDELNTVGKILFLEDLDEYLYHIDRMMVQLKRGGKLATLAGLVIGHFTDMKDNPIAFGKNALEIIAAHVAEFDFPVCYGFPVGHAYDNMTLICGANYTLSVTAEGSQLALA